MQFSYQTFYSLEEVEAFSVFPVTSYRPQINLLKTSKNVRALISDVTNVIVFKNHKMKNRFLHRLWSGISGLKF